MTASEVVDLVMLKPLVRALSIGQAGIPVTDIKRAATEYVDAAVTEISNAADWPFCVDDTSTVSVANQAEYELTGTDNNCRNILDIVYTATSATSGLLLKQMRPIDKDRYMSQRTASEVFAWFISEITPNNTVKVTLFDTPDTAGETIFYRFRKSNVKLSDIPANFHPTVVVSAVAKRLVPNYQHEYDMDMRAMKAYYKGNVTGDITPRDPELIRRNNLRLRLYDYS